MEKEIRTFHVDGLKVETRSEEDTSEVIRGYAAVFDSLSQDLGGFREKIAPGAFAETIKNSDVRALWNHDANYVLGRNGAGTLRLFEDKKGLGIEIDPPETTFAKDLMISMRRGDVTQMSFGFYVKDEQWEKIDGENVRTLRKVELFDVSPVTYPAYTNTEVAVRSLESWKKTEDKPVRQTLRRHRLNLKAK
jgi:HK97 family phage prohead protease